MKRGQTNHYRSQLTQLTARVQKTAAGLEEQVRRPTGGESAGGISNAPLHLADVGSEAYTQELNAALLENEAYIRDEAIAALERLDAGTYGRCEHCGTDIIPERLEAIPYTRYCTPCAAKLQDGRAINLNDGRSTGWLGAPGAPNDTHAIGTPGGGAASGGLAGTNVGDGAPDGANLEAAARSGRDDAPTDTDGEEQPEAVAGPSGGTPANKRSAGTRGKQAAPKRGRK